MKAIDLFCGAGGASCGMYQAGVDVVAAIDQNKQALETHAENLPGETINHDLGNVDPSVLPETGIDWVHGSPPCQGFSKANASREERDPRNSLLFDYIQWVDAIQPKAVSMENVGGMTTISTGFMQAVISAFDEIGYLAKWRELNSADYDVPQVRKRVIVVAFRKDMGFPDRWFPETTAAEVATATLCGRNLDRWTTVAEAIGDLQPASSPIQKAAAGAERQGEISTDGGIENHQIEAWADEPRAMTPGLILPRGQEHDVLEGIDRGWDANKEPAPTVVADGPHKLTGDRCMRKLTPRECARLQSFPDWFVFTGGKTSQYRQIGNAVPPLLQRRIAEAVQEVVA